VNIVPSVKAIYVIWLQIQDLADKVCQAIYSSSNIGIQGHQRRPVGI